MAVLALCGQALCARGALAAPADSSSPELTDAAGSPTAVSQAGSSAGADAPPRLTDEGSAPSDTSESEELTVRLITAYWFVASVVDAGFPYLEPRGLVGYGAPRGTHLAVEAFPRVSATDVGGYAGLSASAPPLRLRAGRRFSYAPGRSFPLEAASYDRVDVELDDRSRARFWSWEARLTGEPQLGPGTLLSESAVGYLEKIPEGRAAYSSGFRVVVGGPWVFSQRLGYLLHFGYDDALRVGLVVDALRDPERRATTLRAGLLARLQLASDLEARLSLVPTWVGPDHLGLMGGDFSELGLRWWWSEPL
ncbi:MAG: hypothetical protein KF915_13210 [Polyangiaceae bacterium]|nr:hypothetical protein [Polyangiaceae bacterium]